MKAILHITPNSKLKASAVFLCLIFAFVFIQKAKGSELYVGAAVADISPELPVALMGQFYLRIAEEADTPLLANVLAIESRSGTQTLDTVIFVSCDLIAISTNLKNELRDEVRKRIPGFNADKIILSATHTHAAPVLEDDPKISYFLYPIPEEGVVSVKAYRDRFVAQVALAIEEAWTQRTKGSFTYGLDRAAIGHNRRVSYKDGTTQMYGNADRADFLEIEGYEDHDIQSIFFWNDKEELVAISVNVACPAQQQEHLSTVNADYWHPVRLGLQQHFGKELSILGWIGASGDVSPHSIYRKTAEARMLQLAHESRLDNISKMVVRAVTDTYDIVKDDKQSGVPFGHQREVLQLPMRIVTEKEFREAKKEQEDLAARIAAEPAKAAQLHARMTWNAFVVKRYEMQLSETNPHYESEIHIVRIGDVAICTNQFELFTDYGIQIKARSKAMQTFVIQLAGPGTYLPTAKAISGGGYSAVVQSSVVGAEGGAVLVEKTVELINHHWE